MLVFAPLTFGKHHLHMIKTKLYYLLQVSKISFGPKMERTDPKTKVFWKRISSNFVIIVYIRKHLLEIGNINQFLSWILGKFLPKKNTAEFQKSRPDVGMNLTMSTSEQTTKYPNIKPICFICISNGASHLIISQPWNFLTITMPEYLFLTSFIAQN